MSLYFNHNNSNNANLYFTTGGLFKKIPPVVQAGNEQADGRDISLWQPGSATVSPQISLMILAKSHKCRREPMGAEHQEETEGGEECTTS